MQHLLIWILFLISGACGLIYEVLWCRHLGLIFGNTVQSLSAVLTAFMGGLALGSYVSGRYCERLKRPLLAYGVLEVLIGAYCALLPWLLGDHSPVIPFYRSLYGETGGGSLPVMRFLISLLLLLVPTTFMGATLPVLSQFLVVSKRAMGRTVGSLYAVNSFGAALGAVAAGFFLLPHLGKAGSNWVAVTLNLVLGAIAIWYALRAKEPALIPEAEVNPAPSFQRGGIGDLTDSSNEILCQAETSPLALKTAIAMFGVTGFAAMATQIGWTRAISLGTGSSTYAFSLIVAVFILGISLGGAWAARAASRTADPLALLASVLVLIGLISLAISVLMGYGPLLFVLLLDWGRNHNWGLLLAGQALGIAILIIVPTFLMGATLPLTLQVAARSNASAGRTTGNVYAINTVGSILGSFFGGLVILPLLGIQHTLQNMALLYAVAGAVLYQLSSSGQQLRKAVPVYGMLVVSLGMMLFGPRWDPLLMNSGMFLLRYKSDLDAAKSFRSPNFANWELLYFKEGADSTVTVMKSRDSTHMTLRVGGKPDASNGGDMSTQVGLTLVPLMLHPDPRDVLVIGLGSGVSTGTALAPDSVQHVDLVEMSPEVVEASANFKEYSGLHYSASPVWLNTPRLQVLINDGRNHLLLSSRHYDVIASEPSNPWMAGVGNLFTREAFELARERLKPGGIMSQWIHSYSLDQGQFFSIMRTFAAVFPHAQLWMVGDADFLLIGSDAKIELPAGRIRERLRQPGIRACFDKVRWDRDFEIYTQYIADSAKLKTLSESSPLHTDDNMLLEFTAPRSLYITGTKFRASQFSPAPESIVSTAALPANEAGEFLEGLDRNTTAAEHYRFANDIEYHSLRGPAEQHWQAALQLAPGLSWVGTHLEKKQRVAASLSILQLPPPLAWDRLITRKDYSGCEWIPAPPDREQRATELLQSGDANGALLALQGAAPTAISALLRARALELRRDFNKALEEITAASKLNADRWTCAELAMGILTAAGRRGDALVTLNATLADPAAAIEPDARNLWAWKADLLHESGQKDEAEQALSRAKMFPGVSSVCKWMEGRMRFRESHTLDEHMHAIDLVHDEAMVLDPLNNEIRADLVRMLLESAFVAKAENEPLALKLCNDARRYSREMCVLQPWSPMAREWLTRSLIALSISDPAQSQFYRGEARRECARLLEIYEGDRSKMPQDVLKAFEN